MALRLFIVDDIFLQLFSPNVATNSFKSMSSFAVHLFVFLDSFLGNKRVYSTEPDSCSSWEFSCLQELIIAAFG